MEFGISIARFGDPLIDPSISKANCCFLLDRKNRRVFLTISDPKFFSLKDETKMLWLREFGVVSNALDDPFKLPPEIEFFEAQILPPDQYSHPKQLKIKIPSQTSRETIAHFARAFWKLLEESNAPKEIKDDAAVTWSKEPQTEITSQLRQFLSRPRIISQTPPVEPKSLQ